MNTDKRSRMALAMGWTVCRDGKGYSPGQTRLRSQIPDPENDANDCNALIKHLKADYDIAIRFHREHGESVQIYGVPGYGNKPLHWQGDNWMRGVCELALKVIDEESG